jgi:GTPase SAR1 family protein
LRDFHFDEIIGRKILIVGDVGSGKTALTARLLSEALAIFSPNDITVIDMAPSLREFKGVIVGGRLIDFVNTSTGVRILTPTPSPVAPRIEGLTAADVLRFAQSNHQSIDRVLKKYSADPTPILFMNDVSMYMQIGELGNLLTVIESAETAILNSYQGITLQDDHGSGVSQHERDGLALLKRAVDQVMTLGAAPSPASEQGAGK